MSPQRMCRIAARALVLGACLQYVAASPALAERHEEGPVLLPLGPFHLDLQDPRRSIPTQEQAARSPLEFGYYLMEASRIAEIAEREGDHERAATFYEALMMAAPGKAVAPRKLCRMRAALGERRRALAACRAALAGEGVTVGDYASFVHLVGELAGDTPRAEFEPILEETRELLATMREDPRSRSGSYVAQCELGARLDDRSMLSECVPPLLEQAPDHPSTLGFAFHRAVLERDFERAREVVAHAREVGIPEELVERMRRVLRGYEAQAGVWRRPVWAVAPLLGLIIMAGLWGRRRNGRVGQT